jgi:hypothetical protein
MARFQGLMLASAVRWKLEIRNPLLAWLLLAASLILLSAGMLVTLALPIGVGSARLLISVPLFVFFVPGVVILRSACLSLVRTITARKIGPG